MGKKLFIYHLLAIVLYGALVAAELFQFSDYVNGIVVYMYTLIPIILLYKDNTEVKRVGILNLFIDLLSCIILLVWSNYNQASILYVKSWMISFVIILLYATVRFLVVRYISNTHYNLWGGLVLFGVFAILILQICIAQGMNGLVTKTISPDQDTFIMLKEFYERDCNDAYVILDESDTSLYVRDITSTVRTYIPFETKEEKDIYRAQNTLGDVKVPVLSPEVEFDDEMEQISYYQVGDNEKTHEDFEKLKPFAVIAVEIWCLLLAGIGIVYERIKKNIDAKAG